MTWAAPARAGDRVMLDVHVVGGPAGLEADNAGKWETVCVGPCRLEQVAATFRFSGAGLVTTEPFAVPTLAGPDTRCGFGGQDCIPVDKSDSFLAFGVGIGSLVVGTSVLIFGALLAWTRSHVMIDRHWTSARPAALGF